MRKLLDLLNRTLSPKLTPQELQNRLTDFGAKYGRTNLVQGPFTYEWEFSPGKRISIGIDVFSGGTNFSIQFLRELVEKPRRPHLYSAWGSGRGRARPREVAVDHALPAMEF
jgi:hypothetical protein